MTLLDRRAGLSLAMATHATVTHWTLCVLWRQHLPWARPARFSIGCVQLESTYSEIVWLGAGWTAPTRANANRTTGLPNSYAGNTAVPYLLLGDPGIPCWPSWSTWDLPRPTIRKVVRSAPILSTWPRHLEGRDAAAAVEVALEGPSRSVWPWDIWGLGRQMHKSTRRRAKFAAKRPLSYAVTLQNLGPRAWRACRRCSVVADCPDDARAPTLRLDALIAAPHRRKSHLAIGEELCSAAMRWSARIG